MNQTVIVREDQDQARELLAQGWQVVATSWGARLSLASEQELQPMIDAVHDACGQGYEIARATVDDVNDLIDADDAVSGDYPCQLASSYEPLPHDLADKLASDQWRAYVAYGEDGRVAGYTVVYRLRPGRWEVDRTAVLPSHRRRGLAKALKAFSIVDTFRDGGRRWGTGGASSNAASLAMNRALGFVGEPLWLTLTPVRDDDPGD